MALPWSNPMEGTPGNQLTAGTVGCDEMGGGSGANATFVSGGLAPGSSVRARFTAERRCRNNTTADLVYAFFVINVPSGNPGSTVNLYKLTSGGVTNVRGGFSMTSSGKIRLVGGTAPDGSNVDTSKSYGDTRTWAILHEYDRLGANNELDPGTARQRLWIFDNSGNLEEAWAATISNTSAIDATYYGINDTITWTIDYDACRGDATRIKTLWKQIVSRVRTTVLSDSKIAMTVVAQGVEQVRAVTGGGSLSSSRTTSGEETDDFGHALVVVEDLPDAGASYEHSIEGYDGSTWTALTSVTNATNRKPGSAMRDVVVDWTCHKQDDTGVLFPALAARVGTPGMYVNKGDFHYDNPGTNAKDYLWSWQWQRSWYNQEQLVDGIKAATAHNFVTMPDDHDIGVLNAEFNSPNIDKCFAAMKIAFPSYAAPGMPSTGTMYGAIQRGEVLHVFTQFSSNYRTDPEAADPGWTVGDPAPAKTPFGTAQDAWLESIFTSPMWDSPGGWVAVVLYLNKGWGGTAPLTGSAGKTDHHAWYPDHRNWLGWLCSQKRVLLDAGDNHLFGTHSNDPYSQSPLVHNAGAFRNSGNTTWDPELEWTYPADPSSDTPLEGAAIIESSRNGTDFTLSATIFDAITGTDLRVVSRTWSGVPYVGDHGWFINGQPLEDLGIGVQEPGNDALRIPGKRGYNIPRTGWDGSIHRADKPYDENEIILPFSLLNNTSAAATRTAVGELARLLDSGSSSELIELRYVDEAGDRSVMAEVVSPISPRLVTDRHAFAAVALTLPDPFWHDTLEIVQELPFEPDENGKQTLWFTATAGATAPTSDAIIQLLGQFPTPRVSDPVGVGDDDTQRPFVQYTGNVNSGNTFTINNRTMEITEQSPGDDPIDKLALCEFSGIVGPFLRLKPRRSDGAYGLRINVSSLPSGNPTVRLTTRRYFKTW